MRQITQDSHWHLGGTGRNDINHTEHKSICNHWAVMDSHVMLSDLFHIPPPPATHHTRIQFSFHFCLHCISLHSTITKHDTDRRNWDRTFLGDGYCLDPVKVEREGSSLYMWWPALAHLWSCCRIFEKLISCVSTTSCWLHQTTIILRHFQINFGLTFLVRVRRSEKLWD